MADLVAGLDEGAPDIVRADDAKLERDAALLRIADRRRCPRIGDRDNEIGLDPAFERELLADALADGIDRGAVGDRIGAREIDLLENARPRRDRRKRPDRAEPAFGYDDQLARLEIDDEGRVRVVEVDPKTQAMRVDLLETAIRVDLDAGLIPAMVFAAASAWYRLTGLSGTTRNRRDP